MGESEIGIGLEKKTREEVRRTMVLDEWGNLMPLGAPTDLTLSDETTTEEALPPAEDPFSIGLHFEDCKYTNNVGEGDLCHVKRNKAIPLTIEGLNGLYLIGLVHTNPTMRARKIVSKDSSGPPLKPDVGILRELSTLTHGSIHVWEVSQEVNVNFVIEGSHRANDGDKMDNRQWQLFAIPKSAVNFGANDEVMTVGEDFKRIYLAKASIRIQVVAELRRPDTVEETMKGLKRSYNFDPSDEETVRTILKKAKK